MLKSIIAFLQFLDERRERKQTETFRGMRQYADAIQRRLEYTEDLLVDEHGFGLVRNIPDLRQAEIDRQVALIKADRKRRISLTELFMKNR